MVPLASPRQVLQVREQTVVAMAATATLASPKPRLAHPLSPSMTWRTETTSSAPTEDSTATGGLRSAWLDRNTHSIDLSTLTQEGWGTAPARDFEHVIVLFLSYEQLIPSSFEFLVDDLSFY